MLHRSSWIPRHAVWATRRNRRHTSRSSVSIPASRLWKRRMFSSVALRSRQKLSVRTIFSSFNWWRYYRHLSRRWLRPRLPFPCSPVKQMKYDHGSLISSLFPKSKWACFLTFVYCYFLRFFCCHTYWNFLSFFKYFCYDLFAQEQHPKKSILKRANLFGFTRNPRTTSESSERPIHPTPCSTITGAEGRSVFTSFTY